MSRPHSAQSAGFSPTAATWTRTRPGGCGRRSPCAPRAARPAACRIHERQRRLKQRGSSAFLRLAAQIAERAGCAPRPCPSAQGRGPAADRRPLDRRTTLRDHRRHSRASGARIRQGRRSRGCPHRRPGQGRHRTVTSAARREGGDGCLRVRQPPMGQRTDDRTRRRDRPGRRRSAHTRRGSARGTSVEPPALHASGLQAPSAARRSHRGTVSAAPGEPLNGYHIYTGFAGRFCDLRRFP